MTQQPGPTAPEPPESPEPPAPPPAPEPPPSQPATSSPAFIPEGVRPRQDVLRAVISLIAEHGVDGMTMRQVSRATGMSTGTINYHFTNKRTLILAALEAAPAAPAPGEEGSPLDRLRALFRGFVLDDLERRAWWRFWVEVTAQSARDADLRDRQRARTARQREEVEDLVARGAHRGELRADAEPRLVAEPLLALAYGLAVQQLIAADEETVHRASEAIEAAIRGIVLPR